MKMWAILLGLVVALIAPAASAQIVSAPLQKIVTPVDPMVMATDDFTRLANPAIWEGLSVNRIEFREDAQSGRTQLALVCSDRPGLLAAVAQVFRARKLRVHDARIATFGERVEDFFQLTDEYNRPLGASECDALRDALAERLAAPAVTNPQTVETYVIS